MKKFVLVFIALLMIPCLSACPAEKTSIAPQETESVSIPAESEQQEISREAVGTMQMKIGDSIVAVEWENNKSVTALKDLVRQKPLTVQMSMYGGFEQVGSIGKTLPRNDVQTTTSAGDIVLYSGNQLVVFYGSNSWAYTRLGHITGKTADELAEMLGNGDVEITISLV